MLSNSHTMVLLCPGLARQACLGRMADYLCRFLDKGGVYKLAFGPKAFIVLSDPVVVRHILKVRKVRKLAASVSEHAGGCSQLWE